MDRFDTWIDLKTRVLLANESYQHGHLLLRHLYSGPILGAISPLLNSHTKELAHFEVGIRPLVGDRIGGFLIALEFFADILLLFTLFSFSSLLLLLPFAFEVVKRCRFVLFTRRTTGISIAFVGIGCGGSSCCSSTVGRSWVVVHRGDMECSKCAQK